MMNRVMLFRWWANKQQMTDAGQKRPNDWLNISPFGFTGFKAIAVYADAAASRLVKLIC